jgi:hypothetical protein
MRTKALLIAASALAVGAISTQAQVYSQNIVGYVNSAIPGGVLSLQAPPFDSASGNYLTNEIVYTAGALDGSPVYIWTGHNYNEVVLDSTLGGVADFTDSYATNCPIINPGTAFFINNQSGAVYTNTYVGTVHIGSGSYPGTSTNLIGAAGLLALVAPVIPVAGGISSVCGLTNYDATGFGTGNGVLNGTPVYIPAYKANGNFNGYSEFVLDDNFASGWADFTDSYQTNEPTIGVGTGFFINNQSGAPIVWIQSLGQ